MYYVALVGAITLAIIILSIMYVSEGFDYEQLDKTYDGGNLLHLPHYSRDWFKPEYNTRVPESYSPDKSGMYITKGAMRYNGQPALSESYGVGYTDERGRCS